MIANCFAKAVVATSISFVALTTLAGEFTAGVNQSPAASASSNGVIHVSITSDDRVWIPSEYVTSYHSVCHDYTYELQVDSLQNRVGFSISKSALPVYDITSSEFAQTMLNRKFFTHIAISCDAKFVRASLTGYDNSSGKPLPVSESILFGENGTIAGDSGLVYEKGSFVEGR